MTDTFLRYQLSQLCQNAIETCPFTNPVAGADCTNKFCNGFPAYISVGTCVSLGDDPLNCCSSSDPTSCLQNFAHGSGSGSGGGGGGASNVCASVISILDTCFTLTPSLSPSGGAALATSGPSATALASCACYDSNGAYAPSQFDGFASDCEASGSAAHPTYFPLVTPLVGLCTNNAGAAASSMDMTTTAPLPSASASAAGSSQMGPGAASTAASPAPTSGGQSAATVTATTGAGAGAGSASSPASSPSAQTTTSKSGGGKVTLRTSAILLLGFGLLVSFH